MLKQEYFELAKKLIGKEVESYSWKYNQEQPRLTSATLSNVSALLQLIPMSQSQRNNLLLVASRGRKLRGMKTLVEAEGLMVVAGLTAFLSEVANKQGLARFVVKKPRDLDHPDS